MDAVGSVSGKTCIIVEGNLHIIYIKITTKNIDMLTEAFCISASYLKRAGANRQGFYIEVWHKVRPLII